MDGIVAETDVCVKEFLRRRARECDEAPCGDLPMHAGTGLLADDTREQQGSDDAGELCCIAHAGVCVNLSNRRAVVRPTRCLTLGCA